MNEESLKHPSQDNTKDLSATLINRRILLPSYFAKPVTTEEVISESGLYLLRVRTQQRELEEITVEREILEQALASAQKEPTKTTHPSDFFIIIESSAKTLTIVKGYQVSANFIKEKGKYYG
ncbi:MAG: hypothetical protein COS84_02315 [Armatimonadetes bacterium CG07_land_8_20_14_0_80_40_9]|nr:MAG: hypothetical protein COS84_02315 [Armatimonadetes bacterium CG07_land_8_20_14_0_80_40_9]